MILCQRIYMRNVFFNSHANKEGKEHLLAKFAGLRGSVLYNLMLHVC